MASYSFVFSKLKPLLKEADAYFTENDIGTKIIAPSLFNAYITSVDTPLTGTTYGGPTRYESAKVYGWGPGLDGYPNYGISRQIGGTNSVIDYAVTNTLTGVGGSQVSAVGTGTYPHEIRLSNYDVHFASKYPIYGSKVEVQFIKYIRKEKKFNNEHELKEQIKNDIESVKEERIIKSE